MTGKHWAAVGAVVVAGAVALVVGAGRYLWSMPKAEGGPKMPTETAFELPGGAKVPYPKGHGFDEALGLLTMLEQGQTRDMNFGFSRDADGVPDADALELAGICAKLLDGFPKMSAALDAVHPPGNAAAKARTEKATTAFRTAFLAAGGAEARFAVGVDEPKFKGDRPGYMTLAIWPAAEPRPDRQRLPMVNGKPLDIDPNQRPEGGGGRGGAKGPPGKNGKGRGAPPPSA